LIKIKQTRVVIYFFLIMIILTQLAFAGMTELPDSVLEETVGEGLAITITGPARIIIPDNTSIGFQTGSGPTAGILSLTDMTVSNCRIEPIISSGEKVPLTVEVGIDSTDPCIPDGTGYIEIGLPSVALLTDSFSAEFATDNNMSVTGVDKLFGISYSSADISLYSGTVIIFPH